MVQHEEARIHIRRIRQLLKRMKVLAYISILLSAVALAQCVSPTDVDTPRAFDPVTGNSTPLHEFMRADFRMTGMLIDRPPNWPTLVDVPMEDSLNPCRVDTAADIDSAWFDVTYIRRPNDPPPTEQELFKIKSIRLNVRALPMNGLPFELKGNPAGKENGIAITLLYRLNHTDTATYVLTPGRQVTLPTSEKIQLGLTTIRFNPRVSGIGGYSGVLKTSINLLLRQGGLPVLYSADINVFPQQPPPKKQKAPVRVIGSNFIQGNTNTHVSMKGTLQ